VAKLVDAVDSKSTLGFKVLVRVRSSVMLKKHFKSKKLVCFDFDGLLVDTEPLHHIAYTQILEELGFPLPLDFISYCKIAHSPNRNLFKETVTNAHPHFNLEWEDVRTKKTALYRQLLKEGRVKGMPGAEKLIDQLLNLNIPICIVTNSDRCDVDEIAKHLPFLQKIPLAITREDYENPKPNPDGYLMALKKHGVTKKDAIGLEDTAKGISALKKAGLHHLFINKQIKEESENQLFSLESFSV
jgi:beta-phosphoglucomutase